MGGVTMEGVMMGGGISTLTMGGVIMGGLVMGGGISTLKMGGVTIEVVSMEGVTMGGGNAIGFKTPILKRVIVVGLISGVVTGVSVATGKGMSDVGGVWGGLGGA